MNKLLRKLLPLLLFTCLLGTTASAYGQGQPKKSNHDARMKEFFEMKKAYLKEKTGMTDEEEAQFFPLYMQLQKKKFDLQRDLHKQMNSIKCCKTEVTDEMYSKVSEAINNARLKEAQLENDYYRKFSKIFSPEKLYKLQTAEITFNRDLLRKGGDPKGKNRPQPDR